MTTYTGSTKDQSISHSCETILVFYLHMLHALSLVSVLFVVHFKFLTEFMQRLNLTEFTLDCFRVRLAPFAINLAAIFYVQKDFQALCHITHSNNFAKTHLSFKNCTYKQILINHMLGEYKIKASTKCYLKHYYL